MSFVTVSYCGAFEFASDGFSAKPSCNRIRLGGVSAGLIAEPTGRLESRRDQEHFARHEEPHHRIIRRVSAVAASAGRIQPRSNASLQRLMARGAGYTSWSTMPAAPGSSLIGDPAGRGCREHACCAEG
jgi:hypothetical protein